MFFLLFPFYLWTLSVSFYKDEWWPCDFWTPVIGYFRAFFLNRAASLFLKKSFIYFGVKHWQYYPVPLTSGMTKKKNQLLKRIIFLVFFFFKSLKLFILPQLFCFYSHLKSILLSGRLICIPCLFPELLASSSSFNK